MGLEHVLLGLLQKPASGYDLKRRFDNEVRYFWAAELTQIYGSLRRLENDGLLTGRVVPSSKGPDRRVYAITAAGRDTLRRWLTTEPEFGNERFGYLAQVYLLASAGDLKRTLWFLTDLRRIFTERLRTFRQIESEATWGGKRTTPGGSLEHFHRFLALRAGILAMAARQNWCDEAIEHVQRRLRKAEVPRRSARRRPSARTKTRTTKGEK